MPNIEIEGERTFIRLSDEKGKLVAYVGGEGPTETRRRARLFGMAQVLLECLKAAMNDISLAAATAKAEDKQGVYAELASHLAIYQKAVDNVEISSNSIRFNAEGNPNYAPYCMRCPGLIRMKKVKPFYWRCQCGAEHDERHAEEGEIEDSICDECGNVIPDVTLSHCNEFHKESCSLYQPLKTPKG